MKTDIKLSKKVLSQKTLKNGSKIKKHAGGRPTLYKDKYCNQIISYMGRGYSIAAFAGKIRVETKTVYNWIEEHEEFLHAVERGRARAINYWESLGMLGMMGKIPGFRSDIWSLNMKNRMNWSEKLTVDPEESCLEEEKNIVESPRDTLKRLMKKYGKQIKAITRD